MARNETQHSLGSVPSTTEYTEMHAHTHAHTQIAGPNPSIRNFFPQVFCNKGIRLGGAIQQKTVECELH